MTTCQSGAELSRSKAAAGLARGRPDDRVSTPSSQKRAWWGLRPPGVRVLRYRECFSNWNRIEIVALIALLKSHDQEICRGILFTGNILQILAFVW